MAVAGQYVHSLRRSLLELGLGLGTLGWPWPGRLGRYGGFTFTKQDQAKQK